MPNRSARHDGCGLMRHLRPEDYRVMPWKNGGGVTTEIAIYPADAGISSSGFIWRVSIAEVAIDGPFSRFPGYDRHIMTIAGKGMQLEADGHGTIDLSAIFVPREFSGDWDVDGQLIDGPVRDFNLMVAREKAKGSLCVERLAERMRYDGRQRHAAHPRARRRRHGRGAGDRGGRHADTLGRRDTHRDSVQR